MEKEKPEHSTWLVFRVASGPQAINMHPAREAGSRLGVAGQEGVRVPWLSDRRDNDLMTRRPQIDGMSRTNDNAGRRDGLGTTAHACVCAHLPHTGSRPAAVSPRAHSLSYF